MVGKGRHSVLGVRSIDPVLALVAPIGLTAALGTGLVIDMAPMSPRSGRTLAELAVDGPSLAELSPGRQGVAFLDAGEIEGSEAIAVIERLAARWPAVTLRVEGGDWPFPVVPVMPLYPGRLLPPVEGRGVWQPVAGGSSPPGPGPVLPRLPGRTVARLLRGQLPRRSRWIAAWRPIWDMPWA